MESGKPVELGKSLPCCPVALGDGGKRIARPHHVDGPAAIVRLRDRQWEGDSGDHDPNQETAPYASHHRRKPPFPNIYGCAAFLVWNESSQCFPGIYRNVLFRLPVTDG